MMKAVALILCVCAIGSQALKPRIIGGATANAGQFPFVAAVYKSTASGNYFCSGALINNQWILTAGACVADAIQFTIRVGSNSLNSNDPNALRLATDTYFLHPDFNPDTLDNDIGLIKLRLPISFTDYIRPISVVASTPIPSGSSVVTLGWGQISDEQAGLVDELNYVYLVTLTKEECILSFGNQITDNMVCVDGSYNEGICRGDLGAPLIQYGGSSLIYHVGVASFISGNGCESPDPSGFTRTSPYVNWILNTTSNN